MNKAESVSFAALEVSEAIASLEKAKKALLDARSEHYLPIAIKLADLKQIYGILTDDEEA
ncbi:hypothetical protein [Paenibacillus sinopodophylli]|uniref:hypothetical protein n=1 Tax=Paenibacillus sinopodophylli TaxID=1837342 RepID=UPI00110CCC2E|nr:hypothetical protein [Paenibacillus sinopodophylli]